MDIYLHISVIWIRLTTLHFLTHSKFICFTQIVTQKNTSTTIISSQLDQLTLLHINTRVFHSSREVHTTKTSSTQKCQRRKKQYDWQCRLLIPRRRPRRRRRENPIVFQHHQLRRSLHPPQIRRSGRRNHIRRHHQCPKSLKK